MAENNLRFSWLDNCEAVDSLADFFVRNVSPAYISHGEILTGRAIDDKTWSPDLHEILHKEITRCAESFRKGENSRVATAVNAGTLSALDVVELVHGIRTLCAWIDDLVVARDVRRMGVGGEFLQWIENELGREGVRHVFLESGITNTSAHVFFERKGYSVCSQVMRKAL
jgi:GNAT superfamily N-acetyltransferase